MEMPLVRAIVDDVLFHQNVVRVHPARSMPSQFDPRKPRMWFCRTTPFVMPFRSIASVLMARLPLKVHP